MNPLVVVVVVAVTAGSPVAASAARGPGPDTTAAERRESVCSFKVERA